MSVSFAIEGPEGGGKSFLASLTHTLLTETLPNPIMRKQEPGGTQLGDEIRRILKNEKFKDMHPVAGTLLFNAARAEQFYKHEIPFLEANPTGILIKERCWLSTKVYQKIEGANDAYVESVMRPFTEIPHKFVIVDCPVEETQVRMAAAKRFNSNREVDWRDLLPDEALTANRNAYLDFVQKNRDRCLMMDCFDEPWDKAARIKFEALRFLAGLEGRVIYRQEIPEMVDTFAQQAREIVETREEWSVTLKRYIRAYPIEELREQVETVRAELNYPSKDELQSRMHEEWRMLGIEGFRPGIERGK